MLAVAEESHLSVSMDGHLADYRACERLLELGFGRLRVPLEKIADVVVILGRTGEGLVSSRAWRPQREVGWRGRRTYDLDLLGKIEPGGLVGRHGGSGRHGRRHRAV